MTPESRSVRRNFNVVRSIEERKGRLAKARRGSREIEEFNAAFIENMELVVIPMCNRKFTWYRARLMLRADWIDSSYRMSGS